MSSRVKKIFYISLLTICISGAPNYVLAADETEALKARIELLERELSEIKDLLKQQAQNTATKEEVNAVKKEVAVARKEVEVAKKEVQIAKSQQDEWKTYDSTVHLGGYAQIGYTDGNTGKNDRFNQVQYSPIFHYQYKDIILLESEFEAAIEEDGSTEFNLEYLTVDWLFSDYLALSAGKYLSPLGQFRQNLHPGWINKLPTAPAGFGHDQAAPIADVGIQFRGGAPFGDARQVNYAFYVSNGPILELNEDGDEIEAVESSGYTDDADGNKIFGGRVGFLPFPNLEIGISGATGDVGLEVETTDRDYDVLGADFNSRWKNLSFRGEFIQQKIGSLTGSVAEEGQRWSSWYLQPSYKFMATNFEAVARYADYDSTHADESREAWSLGLNYLIAPQAIAKVAYEWNDGLSGTTNDENKFFLQLSYGF